VRIEAITASHDCGSFDCGNAALNDWLRLRALTNHLQGYTHVRVGMIDAAILGYYGLSNASALPIDLPRSVKGGQPPNPIPAILIGRFAVAARMQGQGIGRQLFRDALLQCWRVSHLSGVRTLIVHAKDEKAAQFYRHHGFIAHPARPLTLYLPIGQLECVLG
jgi:GNAT superfamily N-acetyltransferase